MLKNKTLFSSRRVDQEQVISVSLLFYVSGLSNAIFSSISCRINGYRLSVVSSAVISFLRFLLPCVG
jgi:hypothetical protein